MVFVEPVMTVRVNGAAACRRPEDELKPGGARCEGQPTVCGWSLSVSVSVRPPASVAVRRSSRYDGYSWSGAVNEPLGTPDEVWTWCWWQFDGQWCRISAQ